MAVKTFTTEVLTSADTNTYLANSGLVYIKTATVTSAASTSTTWQSVFSSEYDSYRMVCHTLTAVTNGSQPRLSFFYSTSTEQTSSYYSAVTNTLYNSTSTITAVNNLGYIALGSGADNLGDSGFTIDILGVGSAGKAIVNISYVDAYNGAFSSGGGLVNASQTFDGMKFVMSSGNISMTATLYGYRKA